MGSYEKLYFNTGVVKLFYKYGWQEFHISNVYIFNIRFLFVCLGFSPFFQKEEKKEDSFADILEPPTLNRITDHRDSRFDSQFHNRCNLYLLRKTPTCSRQSLGVKVHNSTARKTNKQIKKK